MKELQSVDVQVGEEEQEKRFQWCVLVGKYVKLQQEMHLREPLCYFIMREQECSKAVRAVYRSDGELWKVCNPSASFTFDGEHSSTQQMKAVSKSFSSSEQVLTIVTDLAQPVM